MKKISFLKKFMLIILAVIIVFVTVYWFLAAYTYQPSREITYGVTFSSTFATYMGLDWKETYKAILDDLKVKYIRIPVYWNQLEPEKDLYNWEPVDWMVRESELKDVRLILVLGRRQPRWPECHDPFWVKDLSKEEVRAKILKNIELIVNRYKDSKSVEIWQVENEPFLDFFGICPKISKNELREEIDLVKK